MYSTFTSRYLLLENTQGCSTHVLLHGFLVRKSTLSGLCYSWPSTQSVRAVRIGQSRRNWPFNRAYPSRFHTDIFEIFNPAYHVVWYHLSVYYTGLCSMEVLFDYFDSFAIEPSLDCDHCFHRLLHATVFDTCITTAIR